MDSDGDGAVSDGEHDDDDGWIIPKKTVPAKQSKASLDQQASASSPLADVPQQSAEKVCVYQNCKSSLCHSYVTSDIRSE